MDSIDLLFDLFSVDVLFQLNEIIVLLSCLSIIFYSFYAYMSVTKIMNAIP